MSSRITVKRGSAHVSSTGTGLVKTYTAVLNTALLQAFFDTPLEQYTNEKLLALKKDYENDIANLGAGCSACAKSGIKAKYTHKIHQCLTSSHS